MVRIHLRPIDYFKKHVSVITNNGRVAPKEKFLPGFSTGRALDSSELRGCGFEPHLSQNDHYNMWSFFIIKKMYNVHDMFILNSSGGH